MGLAQNGYGGNVLGRANAAANTVVYAVIPGLRNRFTALAKLNYTNGNTANSFTVMRPIGRSTVAAAANSSVATLTLSSDPSPSGNTIAAGDQCVVESADGTYRLGQVNTAGWAANTKIVTFTANNAANVAAGAKFFNLGIFTDTDPISGLAHPTIPTVANTTGDAFSATVAGIRGWAAGDPLLIYNPNATNATVQNFAEYANTVE